MRLLQPACSHTRTARARTDVRGQRARHSASRSDPLRQPARALPHTAAQPRALRSRPDSSTKPVMPSSIAWRARRRRVRPVTFRRTIMCHRIARGVVPCVRLAASGSYCRADIRSRANVRPRTLALTPATPVLLRGYASSVRRTRVAPSDSPLAHSTMKTPSFVRGALAALGFVVTLAAHAHALPKTQEPAADATLWTAPHAVTIGFSEALGRFQLDRRHRQPWQSVVDGNRPSMHATGSACRSR